MTAAPLTLGSPTKPSRVIYFMYGLLLLTFSLDPPWARAFHSHETITKTYGTYFFASLTQAFGVPGVSLSLFEIMSVTLAAWALAGSSTNRASRADRAEILTLLSVPTMVALGFVSGFFQGNDLGLMLTQTRALAMLPIWFVIGRRLAGADAERWGVLAVIAASMAFKSAQGLWYYFHVLGGTRGTKEYLVEHVTSDFLTTAMLAVGGMVWTSRRKVTAAILSAPIVISWVAVFLINDRRTALVGIGLAAAVFAFAIPRSRFIRAFPGIALATAALCAFLAITWNASGALGFPARTLRSLTSSSESSAGYREVENANLLLSVAAEPFMGLGFGKRFPIVYPMPDISTIYAEFDLVPHNTLLFVWAFAGPLGFALFGAFFASAIAVGLARCRQARSRADLALSLIAVAVIIKALAYIYADLGLREVRLLAELGVFSGGLFATDWHKVLLPPSQRQVQE